MLLLGISDSHDASIVLIDNAEVLAAVSEERFTRRKRHQGFPFKSIEYVKNYINNRTIDKVYTVGKYGRAIFRILNRFYSNTNPQKSIFSFSSKAAYWLENIIATTPILKNIESKIGLFVIKKRLNDMDIKYNLIELTDHHYCHIVSSLAGMNSDNYLAVSLDAYGDGKSGLIINVENKKLAKKIEISYKDSIANFYGVISAYMGFKEGDEGKVMALADYGKETILLEMFKEIFKTYQSKFKIKNIYKRKLLTKELKKYSKEDIAFALQKTIEDVVCKFIISCIPKDTRPDLFLAGGLFANIKVNQRLHETGLFNKIFIFPNMGDGGTPFVSVCNGKSRRFFIGRILNIYKLKPVKLRHVYLGPEYTDAYIENCLDKQKLCYSKEIDIEKKVAFLLAKNNVIARFHGRMEYGPRALGNRSILYRTDDSTVNNWLNMRLRRVEYMPFAPVTLFEFKDKCYLNINGAEEAAKFMTISFYCTDWMKKISPGVVHVDGTARPQTIKEEDNPSYYRILKEYYNITGIPSLINTSFNMHNEPIVCSPDDAIQTFKSAKLDYLAIGNFLAKNN